MTTQLFHTIEDRGNYDEIRENAPYLCRRPDAWLGDGYYLWESKKLAHWWGKKSCGNNYVICQTQYQSQDIRIFDLHNRQEHREDLAECIEPLKKLWRRSPTVREIIQFLKEKGLFPYDAIRARHEHVPLPDEQIHFTAKKESPFMSLHPPIQVCVLSKESLKRPVQIIHPLIIDDNFMI